MIPEKTPTTTTFTDYNPPYLKEEVKPGKNPKANGFSTNSDGQIRRYRYRYGAEQRLQNLFNSFKPAPAPFLPDTSRLTNAQMEIRASLCYDSPQREMNMQGKLPDFTSSNFKAEVTGLTWGV